ncbi:MAG TPA: HlyD family efflux transporter periplasmic adaptor subunit [Bacteroidales bacterium]|nr:HlyD family efflux transporter periplasmic adaptor subunit [Bacteroidales bacterium]HPS50860.1 HlyD family efflux transporter periplasmic adaptor subunit [Bacteroidales bacterium]
MKFRFILFSAISLLLFSCNNGKLTSDAAGNFEAVETVVSAEANGKILAFAVTEGEILIPGQVIGYIDSTQLYLTKLQLMQSRKAILTGRPDIKTQLESLEKELANAISDRNRIQNLVKGEVASQKQLDDANTRVEVLKARIDAQKSVLSTSTNTLTEQGGTVEVQLAQVEDQLRKCRIVNPVAGTVISKYVEPFEMTVQGRPLYKIADLENLYIRIYVSETQLSHIKVGQKAEVLIDSDKKDFKKYEGTISWISSKAEFTPKIIQTKEERVTLVYAVKVLVKNDGYLKIGMPGEVNFVK